MAIILYAQDLQTQLSLAKKSIHSSSKSTVWKGYHQYQSLYMQGLLDQNKKIQEEALLGLIEASSKLGLDPSRYRNALEILRPDLPKRRVTGKRADRSVQKPAPIAPLAKGEKRKILKSTITHGDLSLSLDMPLSEKGVHRFTLKRQKSFLYVFDFSPALYPYTIKRMRGEGFKEIRIAQYDPKKVRVVIETTRRYTPILRIEGKKISISLPKSALKKQAPHRGTIPSSSLSKKVSKTSASSPPREKVSPLPIALKKRYTVVIDPGHGGKDSGAVGYRGKKEKDTVLAVAKALEKVLKKRGFRVYMTRHRDRFIPLKNRTRYANRKDADFFISIHANAAPKKSLYDKHKGLETFFLSPARSGRAKRVAAIENSAEIQNIDSYTQNAFLNLLNREKIIESNKLAIDLQKQILTSLRRRYKGVVDNGVREGPFWVLVGAQMPAVLIEIGYITNPMEAKRLFSRRYQKLLAEGIANGIESYILHTHR